MIVWKDCPGCHEAFHGPEDLCCCCRDDHGEDGNTLDALEDDLSIPTFVGCLCPYTCPLHTPGVG